MGLITPDMSGIVDGTVGDAADWVTPMNTIIDVINGGLDNANLATAAAIDISKLSTGAWTLYTSTIVGFSGTPYQMIKYLKIGRSVNMQVQINGTSNTTDFTFTLPFQPLLNMYHGGFWGRDNSLDLGSGALILTSSTTTVVTVYSSPGRGVWTAANIKSFEGSFTYEATT